MTLSWLAGLLMAVMTLQGWGQSQSEDHFALTARLVAQTLSAAGTQTSDEQVSLLARVVATEPYPKLDILSVEALGDAQSRGDSAARSMVKLTCDLPGTCLPFYAIVTWPEEAPPVIRSEATPVVKNARAKTNDEITMRAGTHAILVMDDHRSRIQVAVISLENGVAGKWIRVASPDHKQVYTGEVVSANVLRGNF
jgi:hypothetical protein